jgi:hypothetical protein
MMTGAYLMVARPFPPAFASIAFIALVVVATPSVWLAPRSAGGGSLSSDDTDDRRHPAGVSTAASSRRFSSAA